MNQELSPTEQQQVESAANKFASRSVSMGEGTQYLGECNTIVGDKYKGFEAGVEWALQNLLPLRMEKFAEWINVEDKLPEFNQEVLVYGKRRLSQPTMDSNPPKIMIGMRQDLSGSSIPKKDWLRYADKNNFRMMEDVTHWRPLPEPPQPLQ